MQPNDQEGVNDNAKEMKDRKYVYDRRINEESHDNHVAGGSHGTEMGWLVSYADMMTLLFGLFVLLYVMASEKKGNIQENMKEVSEKYFSDVKTDEKAKKTPKDLIDPEVLKKTQAALALAQIELAKVKQIPDQRMLVADLQKQIEELKKLQNPDQSQVVKDLQAQLEKAQAELKKLLEIPNQQKMVADLQKQIEQLKKLQNPNQAQLVAELQKKIEDLNKQNQELSKREIASVDKKFMMVSATWATEKHDVDLYVTDPNNFTYSFKNKRGPSSIGTFEIDSRFGPGLELWKTEDLKPGKYKIHVNLYKQYENFKDAEVKIHVVTSKGSQYLKPAVLNTTAKDKYYEINVDEKGNISAL